LPYKAREALLKAIQTRYKGYRFRSRLYARWAVFFDTLGIEYRYEPEGFDLAGEWYLPDFYLPEQQYWIEIKGQPPSEHEKTKAFFMDLDFVWTDIRKPDHEPKVGYNGDHSVYIFWGDIPWPYPSQGHAIPGDLVFHEAGSLPYCWQQCPVCRKLEIWIMGEPFCGECLERLRNAVSFEAEAVRIGHPPELDVLSEVACEVGRAVVNEDLFRSGHKSRSLQSAYAKARAARF
jgi:hypothetical protein